MEARFACHMPSNSTVGTVEAGLLAVLGSIAWHTIHESVTLTTSLLRLQTVLELRRMGSWMPRWLLWFPGRRVSRHCPGDSISFAALLGNFYTNCSQKFNLKSSHRRLTRVSKVKQMDYSILEMGR
ncbi:hypothetical protein TNCV_1255801, partial [Trichonephila clavipes]